MGERAEHPADRVAQFPVVVADGLQDFRADALIVGIIDARDPKPQDVGAGLLDDVLREGLVAQRLRHFPPLLVEREAVRQHDVERRAAARAAALEQGRLEPAAMLVGAFQIHHLVGAAVDSCGGCRRGRGNGRGPRAHRRGSSRNRTRRRGCRRSSRSRRGRSPARGSAAAAPSAYQASAPSSSNASAMRLLTRSSTSGSCSPFLTNTAIGTPQARCRLITQSGLAPTMPRMRFSPDAGTQRVSPIALSAVSRKVGSSPIGLSIAMNHCGVLRKMTGFFERQECGYWCLSFPRATRLPAAIKALMTASLASPFSPLSVMTRLPSKPGASAVKAPFSSTV